MRRTTILILTILTCMQSVHGQNDDGPVPFEASDFGWNETQEPEHNVTQAWNLTEVNAAVTSAPIAAQMLYERLASKPNATKEEVVEDIRQFVSEIWKTIEKLIGDSDGAICIAGITGFSIDLDSKPPAQLLTDLQQELTRNKGINVPVIPHRDAKDEGTFIFQSLSIFGGSCASGSDGKIPVGFQQTSSASAGISLSFRDHIAASISIGDSKEWAQWASGSR